MKVGPWHGPASMHANSSDSSHTYTWYTHTYNIGHGISTSTLPPSCHCMSFFLTLHTISLYLSSFTTLSTFLSSIDVFVSFYTPLTQVHEDNGSLALTLRSTRAASQPFTVHLNSRLLPPGDNTATGECTVCRRSIDWMEVGLNDTDVRMCVGR